MPFNRTISMHAKTKPLSSYFKSVLYVSALPTPTSAFLIFCFGCSKICVAASAFGFLFLRCCFVYCFSALFLLFCSFQFSALFRYVYCFSVRFCCCVVSAVCCPAFCITALFCSYVQGHFCAVSAIFNCFFLHLFICFFVATLFCSFHSELERIISYRLCLV